MTYRIAIARRPETDAAAVARRASANDMLPITFTTESGFGKTFRYNAYGPFGRNTWRRAFTVQGVDGDSLAIAGTSSWDTLPDGFANGAVVRAYRVVDAALTLVREDTVAHWFARERAPLRFGGGHVLPGTATACRWAPDSGYRRGAEVRFAVSAVAGDGTHSPIGAVLTYTTPAAHAPQTFSTPNPDPLALALTGEDAGLAAPANAALTTENGGAVAVISWDPVPGAAGYVVWRTQYRFDDLVTDRVDLVGGAGQAALEAGDMIVVDLSIAVDRTVAQRASDRVYHYWQYHRPAPTPFGYAEWLPAGTTVAYVDDPAEGAVLRVVKTTTAVLEARYYTHGGSEQHYYDHINPTRPTAASIRLRGTGTVRVVRNNSSSVSRTVIATPDWQTHTVTFDPEPVPAVTAPLDHRLRLDGACDMQIAWIVFHGAGPGEDASSLPGPEQARLAALKPSFIRTHEFCKRNPWCYTLDSVTSLTSPGTHGNQSLPLMLRRMEAAGTSPWLQIEWVWSEAEWLGLAEYLCAPYDPTTDTPAAKPWAYRRHRHRPAGPWLDAFPALLLELGNENWNTLGAFYPLPGISGETSGTVNGLMLDYVAGLLRSSPHWSAEATAKVGFVLGGWRANAGFTRDAAAASRVADYLTIADYNGGWDSGETAAPDPSNPAAWAEVVGDTLDRDVRGKALELRGHAAGAPAARTTPLRLGTYEAGPGYVMNGLNGASVSDEQAAGQELVMKSVGAGTATIDGFLMGAAHGVTLHNFFTYGARTMWASHAPDHAGGALNAPAQWCGWLNHHLLPAQVREITPLLTARGVIAGEAGRDRLGAYRLDRDGKAAVVLCNRDTTAAVSVTLAAEVPATGTLTRHAMTGDYQTTNLTAATAGAIAIEATPEPYARRIEATVPPGQTVIYVWGAG